MSTKLIHRCAASVIVFVLTAGLTACAPAAPSVSTFSPLPPTLVPIPTYTAVATQTPIPTPTNTAFVPKAVIKIVAQLPADTHVAEGAQLAVEQLAGPLRDLGFDAQFQAYDDQSNVDVALKNAKELIADPQVLCGVGHYNSGLTINLADIYHVAGLAMISPSNTSPKLSQLRYVEINRVSGRDDSLGEAAAKFVEAQASRSVFIIRNGSDFGDRAADRLKTELGNAGLKIAGDEVASPQRGNVETVAGHVVAVTPDVVFYAGGSPDEAGAFFKQVRLAGYLGMLLDWLDQSAALQTAGAIALEGAGLYEVDFGGLDPSVGSGSSFVETFQTVFGEEPPGYAAEAYDAAGICLKAIEEASKAKGGDLPTRKEVAAAVRGIKDYPGITGIINFNDHGDRALVRYSVKQITSADANNWYQNPTVATFELPPPK